MLIDFYKNEGANYFMTSGLTPIYIDHLRISKIYKPPQITDEWVNEEDVSIYRAGDFDITLSLLITDTSDEGDTIEDFFNPQSADPFTILCCLEVDGKKRHGFVDLTSVEVDKTITQNNYEISFKAIGVFKAVSEYLKTIPITQLPIPSDISFDSYLTIHLWATVISWLQLNNVLDLNTRVGSTVKINYMRQRGLYDGGLNTGYSIWSALQSFAQFCGFAMRVDWNFDFTAGTYTFPYFKLTLFWLSDGNNEVTIQMLNNKKSYTSDNANKYVIVKTSELSNGAGQCDGIIIKNGATYSSHNYLNDANTWFRFDLNDSRFRFLTSTSYTPPAGWEDEDEVSSDEMLIIELPFHAWSGLYATNIAYAAILTLGDTSRDTDFTGINTILDATAGVEYAYLIQGIKRVRDMDIVYNSADQIGLHDYFDLDDTTYRIDKLETDIVSRTAEIRAVEI